MVQKLKLSKYVRYKGDEFAVYTYSQERSLATGRYIGPFFWNYDKKYFFGYHDPLKIYGATKLCTVMY